MRVIKLHKSAQKALLKTPKKIRLRAEQCILYLQTDGTLHCPFIGATLKGPQGRLKYYEAKVDKDYRLIFRINNQILYIRAAGTHNSLGTG